MTTIGIYIGYGCIINVEELAKKINVDIGNRNPELTYGECDDHQLSILRHRLSCQAIHDMISFPHTSVEYKSNKIAIGYFVHVKSNDSYNSQTEIQLRNIMNLNLVNFHKFFGSNPQFMVISDDQM